ncbi:MAG TPA: DNA-protecting protein DprA, partial [Thioalkalivibrio sp.]|nr:DNA-protecting protein DprA [Thioalkalivibrio sp.]
FVAGEPRLLLTPQLAIVGSRHPTPGGRESAYEFARHLAGHGLTITSGLALGIDAAAHEGALAAPGLTVAVAATGLDRVYPSRHRALAHEIAEQGALVSEFSVGTGTRAEHFPRRNRIISGLAVGTLVVEAALRSGSLITARLATDQGREVFAIPGSIHNPLARGCHRLIRDGAKLVETAQDILEELDLSPTAGPPEQATDAPTVELDAEYHHLLMCMGYDPVPIDTLVQRSGLTTEAVSSMLLVLELRNLVASLNGGRYERIKPRD